MKIPFIGPSYVYRSLNFDAQRSVNLYPVKSEVGDSKDITALVGTPGLQSFCELISPLPGTQFILDLNFPGSCVNITTDKVYTFNNSVRFLRTMVGSFLESSTANSYTAGNSFWSIAESTNDAGALLFASIAFGTTIGGVAVSPNGTFTNFVPGTQSGTTDATYMYFEPGDKLYFRDNPSNPAALQGETNLHLHLVGEYT